MKDTAKKVKLISDEIRALAQEAKKINQVAIGKNLQMLAGEVRRVETKEANKTKIRDVAGKVKHFDTAKGTSFSKDFQEAFTGINVNSSLNDLVTKAKELGNTDMAKGIREFQQELNKEKGMQELNEQVKEVKSSLEKLGYDSTTIDKFEQKIKDTTQETNKLTTSLRKVSEVAQTINSIIPRFVRTALSLQGLRTIFNTIVGGFGKIIDVTEQSSAYIENMHMFEVSMGKVEDEFGNLDEEASKYYKRGIKFQNELHEKFGTNMSDTLKYQGLFNQMAKSMNIPEKQAYLLSENFTKLGYDLSSLYNLDPSDAMQKLRAGLAGQTKPLRDIGLDITQQSLAPKLKELGIERSVKQLSQAEKMVLRYIVVLEQAEASHGDFAKTIETPANQLRVLKEQLKELTQAFGNMFLPILKQVLPYINGFVMALKEVFNVFAVMFGYTEDLQEGMSSLNSDAELDLGYGDELEEAKKLKSFTLGFDELNVLKEDDSDSSGAGIGGAVDSRLLDAMKEYDNLMSSVTMKATEIRDRIMEWLGFVKGVNEEGKITWSYLDEGYTGLEKIRDIVLVLLGFKLTFGIINFLAGLGETISGFSKLKKFITDNNAKIKAFGKTLLKIAGVVMAIIGILNYFETIFTVIRTGNMSLKDFATIVRAILLIVGGIALVFGAVPALIAGIIGAVGLLFTTVVVNWDELVTNFKVWFNNAKARFSDALTSAIGLFKKFTGTLKLVFEHVTQDISTFFANNFGDAIKTVATFLDTIISAMLKPINTIIELFGGKGLEATNFKATVETWIEDNKGDYKTADERKEDYAKMYEEIDTEINNLKNIMTDFYEQEERDIYSNYLDGMTEEEIEQRKENARELREFKNSVKDGFSNLGETIGNKISEATNGASELLKGVAQNDWNLTGAGEDETSIATSQNTFNTANEIAKLNEQFNMDSEESLEISEEISDEISFSNDLTDKTNTTLGSVYNFLKTELMTKLQGIKEACENIRINIIHEHYYGGEGYATGGMPSSASLFYAHENGMPELVGKIGNNTTVMNNEQIVSAVAMGVAEAVASVMGERQTIVQIDGKEILSATEKAKKTRGYGIVGGAFAKG